MPEMNNKIQNKYKYFTDRIQNLVNKHNEK